MDKLERTFTPPIYFSSMRNNHAVESCNCPACKEQEHEQPRQKPVDWFQLNREFSHG